MPDDTQPQGAAMLPLLAPLPNGIQPAPTSIAVNAITDPSGKRWVVMQFGTHSGVQFYFFENEIAKQFADLVRSKTSDILVAQEHTAQQLADFMAKRRKA